MAENGQEGVGGRGNEKVDERKDEMLALPEVATVKAPIRRKSRVRPATGSPPRSARQGESEAKLILNFTSTKFVNYNISDLKPPKLKKKTGKFNFCPCF